MVEDVSIDLFAQLGRQAEQVAVGGLLDVGHG